LLSALPCWEEWGPSESQSLRFWGPPQTGSLSLKKKVVRMMKQRRYLGRCPGKVCLPGCAHCLLAVKHTQAIPVRAECTLMGFHPISSHP
ncbi:Hypothetical predicted protein, partial [Pelobates cultripes]